MKKHLAYQVCYAIAALLALSQSASAAGIATVVDVVNEGYRQPPGAEETTAKTADELVQNEALRTEAESTIAGEVRRRLGTERRAIERNGAVRLCV